MSAARASGGPVSRQEMRDFGQGWSGNAQLFWSAPSPTDKPIRNWPHLSLPFDAPAADTYEVILHCTAAPDFATFRVFIDGQPGADVDGYAPSVTPQERSLGQHKLAAGRHELVVTVFAKAGASGGFSVGLDRIELRPLTATPSVTRGITPAPDVTRGSRSGGQTRPPKQVSIAAGAELNFGAYSDITIKWTLKGGTENTFDADGLFAHLVWESTAADKVAWRWQVSTQPFSELTLSPPGLLAQQDVSEAAFTIDLGSFPPLNAVKSARADRAVALSRQGDVDLYIRLIAVDGGRPVVASNAVVAHYRPGSNKSFEIMHRWAEEEARRKAEQERLDALYRIYEIEILEFKPAVFPDPNRWGCVEIIKNPYVNKPLQLVSFYGPGEHCGKSYTGEGHKLTSLDYVTGWVKAYDIISGSYDNVKAWTAKQFAKRLPCEKLGKAGAECEKYASQLAGVAINAGLAVAGVPPSMPNLNEVAKGHAVNAAVDLSCLQIESNGGKCTPELRSALQKAYKKGLDKLAHDLNRTTKEPACGDKKTAHDNGREPLPCFGDYPGIEFRPAKGAVWEPPQVRVRVHRTSVGPAQTTVGRELVVSMSVKNTFAGTIETYSRPVPPTNLEAELFVPARVSFSPPAVGHAVDLTLSFGGMKQYEFSTTDGGYAKHDGRLALYNGGLATLTAWITCRGANWSRDCAKSVEWKQRLPFR